MSYDTLETCRRCGAPMVASGMRGAPAGEQEAEAAADDAALPEDLRFLRLETAAEFPATSRRDSARRRRSRPPGTARGRGAGGGALAPSSDDGPRIGDEELAEVLDRRTAVSAERDGGPEFCIDDDLFPDNAAAAEVWPGDTAHLAFVPPGEAEWPLPALSDPEGPGLLLDEEKDGGSGGAIIDRDEEVPERFWAPEVAGLGRRGLALIIDQVLLGIVLGVFFLGAGAALRLSGLPMDSLFAATVLRAALPPFALLAALLSLAYHVFFHGRDGRTPGKALTGVEVRTRGGSVPSLGRSALRWFAAALGFSCAGAGIVWAFFHPRRCGWADLLSATLVAESRRPPAHQRGVTTVALTTPGGAGTIPPL